MEKAATEMAGGALGAGAAGLLAIPSGPGAAVAAGAGYMGGSTAAGTAFDALFPQTVNPVVPEKKPSSSSSEKAKKVPAGAFGAIVNKFDASMAPSNVPAGAFGDIVNKFDNAMNPSSETEIKFELPTFAATGTDTGSGDREVQRSAPPKELSAGMAAWAAANPELAKKMVDKVDARRMKNPEYTQSGYDPVREVVYPGNAALAAEQNQGDFSIRDAVGGKMSPEDAGTIASGGFVETVFDNGVQSPSTSSNDQEKKSIDLLNNYISKNKPAVIESTIPSQAQGVAPVGGDGTILDSELEIGKARS